jgi:hypothetical protein
MNATTMGIDPQLARQIVQDEVGMYKATRYRLTTRLTILNRVEADPQQRQALQQELETLERIIAEYESEAAHLLNGA